MPLDASIYRLPAAVPIASPLETQAQLGQIRAQQQQGALHAQQLEQNRQRLADNADDRAAAKATAFSKQQIHDAAETAYRAIKDGNADAVLNTMAPEARAMAEGWLTSFQETKKVRDAQAAEDGKQLAKFIQASGYDPVTSMTTLKLLGDIHPGAKDALAHVDDPAAFKKLIDHFATLGDKPPGTREIKTRNADGSESIQIVPDVPTATAFQSAPVGITAEQQAVNARADAAAAEAARHNRATEAQAARQPAGTPIWVERNGEAVRVSETQIKPGDKPYAPKPAGGTLSAGALDKIAGAQTSLAALDSLERLYTDGGKTPTRGDAYIGPVAGAANAVQVGAPGMIGHLLPKAPAGFADFSAETATLKNQTIQAITGAGVGVTEAKRIMDQIPDLTDTPAKWQAKAKATRRNLEELIKNQSRGATPSAGSAAAGEPKTGGTKIGRFDVSVEP